MDIQKYVKRELYQFIDSGVCMVVAVSGGIDSLALLHVLAAICDRERLVVAHFDHRLRASSRSDAAFVEKTAVSLNLPFFLGQHNVRDWAKEQSVSLEEAGRELRYRFLVQTAKDVDASAIAVAHHADDQAETILMHLLRGSGLSGLRGMQASRPFIDAPHVLLIRPFLSIRRSAIAAYCKTNQLKPILDESNDDTTFFRNRIRHQLLPLLKFYSPQIMQRLKILADIVAADYDFLDTIGEETWKSLMIDQTDDWLTFDRLKWLSLHLSMKRLMLRKAVRVLRPFQNEVGFQTIEQARRLIEKNQTGAQAMLPGGLQLLIGSRTIAIAADLAQLPVDVPQLKSDAPLHLPIPGQVDLQNGWTLKATINPDIDLKRAESNEDEWQAFAAIDLDAVIVRPRNPGERFQPLGMQGHSAKLKDVMKNIKLPVFLRDHWPIVAIAEHLVWFVGHQIDERVRVHHDSVRIVTLQCVHQDES